MGSEMVKGKRLIEKVWWMIPPMVVVFGIPLFHTFRRMATYGHPLSSFVDIYIDSTHAYMFKGFFSFPGGFIILSMFVSMGIGYYLSRRKTLALQIIIPIIAGFLGYFISMVLVAMMYAH